MLSQLIGFLQLFVALLLVTGALGPNLAGGGLGGLMVGCNAVVAVASSFDADVDDFADMAGDCCEGAFFRAVPRLRLRFEAVFSGGGGRS